VVPKVQCLIICCPDLRQKACGVQLRKYLGINLVGHHARMGCDRPVAVTRAAELPVVTGTVDLIIGIVMVRLDPVTPVARIAELVATHLHQRG